MKSWYEDNNWLLKLMTEWIQKILKMGKSLQWRIKGKEGILKEGKRNECQVWKKAKNK